MPAFSTSSHQLAFDPPDDPPEDEPEDESDEDEFDDELSFDDELDPPPPQAATKLNAATAQSTAIVFRNGLFIHNPQLGPSGIPHLKARDAKREGNSFRFDTVLYLKLTKQISVARFRSPVFRRPGL